MAFCAALCGGAAFGQGPGDQSGGGPGNGPGGPGGRHGRPPLPPVIRALDTNHDGIIEADEIANAAQSLKTLEKSGSNELTIPDLLGPRPPRPPRWNGGGQGQGPQSSGTQAGDSGPPDGPPPPPPDDNGPGPMQSGSNGQANGGPPPGGPGGHHHRMPPVIQALDTNHDGIIEADEIENAPQSLKTLEKNGSDQLTIPDLLGPPPHGPRPGGQGQGNDQGGPPPPPDDNGPSQSGTNSQGDSGPPPPPPPQ